MDGPILTDRLLGSRAGSSSTGTTSSRSCPPPLLDRRKSRFVCLTDDVGKKKDLFSSAASLCGS